MQDMLSGVPRIIPVRAPTLCLLLRFCRRKSGIMHWEQLKKEAAETKTSSGEDDIKNYNIFGNKHRKEDVFHYTDRKAGRGYSDFAHSVNPNRPYIWPPLRKLYWWNWAAFIVAFAALMIDFEGLCKFGKQLAAKFQPEAATVEPDSGRNELEKEEERSNSVESESCGIDESKKKKKKKKIGFRERRIIEYENRIRLYSAPDKIFRYFATLKVPNDDGSLRSYDIYMTPEDFVRSLTPGVMQPRSLGLDKFKFYEPDKCRHEFAEPTSIFAKLGEHGLISFGDYLFLMTLLSTPPKDFELAFRIFDLNGDGELDKDEFERVQELVMSQTSVGQRHRDRITSGLSARKSINSAISSYFFGKDGSKKLSIEKFLKFQAHLHRDILKIECERRDVESMPEGVISEISFADLLLMHSCLSEAKQRKMLKRVKRKWGSDASDRTGITLEEVNAFFCFLYYIEDVDLALHFYNLAGASIDGEVLKTVARKIAGREISDHVVDVVVTLFDDNQDGQLSNKEFVAVMKRRMKRGLEHPRDTGLMKLLGAVRSCTINQLSHAVFQGCQ